EDEAELAVRNAGHREVGRAGDRRGGADRGLLGPDAVLHDRRVGELCEAGAVLGDRGARLPGAAAEADEAGDGPAGVRADPLLLAQVLHGLEYRLGGAAQRVE